LDGAELDCPNDSHIGNKLECSIADAELDRPIVDGLDDIELECSMAGPRTGVKLKCSAVDSLNEIEMECSAVVSRTGVELERSTVVQLMTR